MFLSHLSTLATFLPHRTVIIPFYLISLPLPPSYQLDLLSYVSIPPLYPFNLFTNLTCYHTSISHLPTLATFLPTWSVIIRFYSTSLPLPPSYQLDLLLYVSARPLHPCHLHTNLTCYHTFPSHLSTLSTFLQAWPATIRLYPTSLPLPPSYHLDMLSTFLSCLSTLAIFLPTWPVIIRLYPTSLPLPPSYHLDLLSYVSIPPLYPCHILTNLTCYHTSLSHLSTLSIFLLTSFVIIRVYPTSLALSITSSSTWSACRHNVYITPLYLCHLRINLICYHTSLSHVSILVTSLSTWSFTICFYHTSLPMPPPYLLDLLSYVSIPPLYPYCHLLINLICHHMFLSHLCTYATSVSTLSVIICVYPTSLILPHSDQRDLSSYVSIPHL